jgi:serine/threonine protein kinase
VGREGDAVYFAMDYLPSGLAQKLEASHTLPEEMVIHVGIDVARALGFAHREGVIHRDIKVDNILFDVHGNAVVCDFGIARAVSGYTQQTGTNMVVGTPQYFAPEQARAKALDGRADIYSLGVSLYRSVCGRLPFEGEDWYDIARAHVEDEPPSPRSLNPVVSPAFEQLLLRCLAKHVDDRPATAEQMADELAAVLEHPEVVTTSATPSRGGTRRSLGDTPTLTDTKRVSGARSQASLPGIAVAVIALIAGAAVSAPWLIERMAPRPVEVPQSLQPATVVASVNNLSGDLSLLSPDSSLDPIDSALAAISGRPAERPKPEAPRLQLHVSAPPAARLTVNGEVVSNPWRNDGIKVGDYRLRATVPAPPGCPTSTDSSLVRIRAGTGRQDISLSPRSCGTLIVTVPNATADARYSLASSTGVQTGTLVSGAELLLPVGQYELRVQQGGCRDFSSDVSIGAERSSPITFRLLCDVPRE